MTYSSLKLHSLIFDTHCHLQVDQFDPDRDDVFAKSQAAGVGHFLTIGTELESFPRVRAVAERSADIHCTVGVHPHSAEKETNTARPTAKTLRRPNWSASTPAPSNVAARVRA